MTDPLFAPRQWAERRRTAITAKEAAYFVAELVAGKHEPCAPTGAECELCGSEIIGGICNFCDSVYVDGVRVKDKTAPLPFDDHSEITG